MTDTTETSDRDQHGRFLAGNSGNGGRRVGARSKLGTQFLEDLREVWKAHGKVALERCALEEPAAFMKTVALLLPRQAEIDVGVSVFADVRGVVEAYRLASDLLGTDPKRGLRRLKQIETGIEDDDDFTR